MYLHPQFQTDVIKPLRIDELMDQEVQHLSGGELQRVAITMCLGKEADLYLIDEPSAYLDSEQRIIAAKVGCIAASQDQAVGLQLKTVGFQHVGNMLLHAMF
jgi:translation initiation factor RLI1